MQSHQIVRSLLKSKMGEEALTFFDSLNLEEQGFIENVLMAQPNALEINIAFPKVTILVAQIEFTVPDIMLMLQINALGVSKLDIKIYLNEIINATRGPNCFDEFAQLQSFDLVAHRNKDTQKFLDDLFAWRQSLQPSFLEKLSLRLALRKYDENLPYFMVLKNLNFLYLNYSSDVDSLITQLLPFLSYKGILCQSLKEVDEEFGLIVKKAIIAAERVQGFVLRKCATSQVKEVKFLLGILKKDEVKTVDENGNNIWHFVKCPNLFDVVYEKFPDLDAVNNDGNTSLHLAVKTGDVYKIQYLLAKGADADILNNKGETCWSISLERPDKDIELFMRFALSDFVITYPAIPSPQKGPNCGLYAAALVINYYILIYRNLFADAYVLARKCDLTNAPKDRASLRHIAKQKKFTKVGEILSMKDLAELLGDNQCPTTIYSINDYNNFIDVLKEALKNKQPVIVPFCFSLDGTYSKDVSLDAGRAHIATCISIREEDGDYYCLMAHHGGYQEIEANDLYHAFYDVPDTMPALYFYKLNGEWQKFLQPQENLSTECRLLTSTNLSLFRRQLLVTHPPHQQDRSHKITESVTQESQQVAKRHKIS